MVLNLDVLDIVGNVEESYTVDNNGDVWIHLTPYSKNLFIHSTDHETAVGSLISMLEGKILRTKGSIIIKSELIN